LLEHILVLYNRRHWPLKIDCFSFLSFFGKKLVQPNALARKVIYIFFLKKRMIRPKAWFTLGMLYHK
jgi:hypothetical protein